MALWRKTFVGQVLGLFGATCSWDVFTSFYKNARGTSLGLTRVGHLVACSWDSSVAVLNQIARGIVLWFFGAKRSWDKSSAICRNMLVGCFYFFFENACGTSLGLTLVGHLLQYARGIVLLQY